jgi:DNA-binding NarL/FixJ family response regulator
MGKPPVNTGDPTRASATSAIRLLIFADVRLYREGLRDSLASREPFEVVGAVSTVDETLRLARQSAPHVVIVDMATRDCLSGVRVMREQIPHVPLVGFGVEEVAGEILACAEAGLAGYVPNEATLDDLVARVMSVCRGELLCPPRIAASLFRRLEAPPGIPLSAGQALALTARERDVLGLIDAGLSNKEIAGRLSIEVSTVKNHVHRVLEKLQVTSRGQAAAQLGSHLSMPGQRSRKRSTALV